MYKAEFWAFWTNEVQPIKLMKPAPLFLCHWKEFWIVICWFLSAMAEHNFLSVTPIIEYILGSFRNLKMTFHLPMTFELISPIIILSSALVPSQLNFVCFEPGSHWWCVSNVFTLLINEYGRKIVQEKQFLRRHNNSCPHFSHPLRKERENLTASCTERYTYLTLVWS